MSQPSNPSGGRQISQNYKWWVVAMLWFICFFNYADRQAISSVFPKLKEEFGYDELQLGLIGSAFMWVYAFGAPVAGYICDRFRRKDLILGGCIFWSFVTMITGSCSKLWQFVTVRALEGLGETFYFPASMSLTSDWHGPETRSRALSFHQSSVYVGTILGSWMGAWFAEKYNWRVGFYFFGGAGLLLAVALWKFLIEPKRGSQVSDTAHGTSDAPPLPLAETIAAIFRSPAVPFLMLAFVGANFVATIFLTWAPTFLVEKFGYKLASAGLSGTIFIHLASAVSVPIAGMCADKLSRKFSGGRMMIQLIGLACGAIFVFLVGHTGSKQTLIISMMLYGWCKGFYDSGIFASLYDAIEPRARGSAAGLMNTVGWAGGALGPLFVGVVSKYGSAATKLENMSNAISFGGVAYVFSAVMIAIALLKFRSHSDPGKVN